MRISSFLLLALFTSAPAAGAERRFTVTDFDRIQVSGPFTVTLTTGRASSASAEGSRAALDRIEIDVQGRTLRIRPSASAWGGYPGKQEASAAIKLTTQALRAVVVDGSGSLTVDKARGLRFDAGLRGSGQLAISGVETDGLLVSLYGSGKIILAGRTKTVRAEVRGSGDLEAGGLTAGDAQLLSESAGTVKLAVDRGVTINANGSGDIDVIGKPACTVKQTGSGAIRCGGE